MLKTEIVAHMKETEMNNEQLKFVGFLSLSFSLFLDTPPDFPFVTTDRHTSS